MSTFKVGIEKLSNVWDHPNADKLELASVEGMTFQFVIPKGKYKTGDAIVYFPVDALIPTPIVNAMGLTGRLSGPEKNRVKTVKLRGQVSQGLVESLSTLQEVKGGAPANTSVGSDITEWLGVTKYEPPVKISKNGILLPLPLGVPVYDLEGADRYPAILELLMNESVMITEKLEGTNFSITRLVDGTIRVNQRNYTIQPAEGDEHEFWRVARERRLIEFVNVLHDMWPDRQITVRGELVGPGIQGNIYGLKQAEVYIFDIMNGSEYTQYLPADLTRDICDTLSADFDNLIKHVPIIWRGWPDGDHSDLRSWLGGRTVAQVSNGSSALNSKTLREGIVIKPLSERYHSDIGRLILKQRSPEYLAGSDF